MKKSLLFLTTTIIFAGLLLGCFGPADELESANVQDGSRSLYVFGDSWADAMDDGAMQRELADRGFDNAVEVMPFGIGGTTMAQWGNDFEGITSEMIEVIQEDPKPEPMIFFTLAGNDILEGGNQIDLTQDMRNLLIQLEASRDDLQIVYAPYDILNPAITPDGGCMGLFEDVFGSDDPTTINQQWLDIFNATALIANEFERVTAVNTYGTLQGRPGNPDLGSWSATDYLADCIHLNDIGYGIYLDTVFDEALAPLIEQEAASTAPALNSLLFLPSISLNADS